MMIVGFGYVAQHLYQHLQQENRQTIVYSRAVIENIESYRLDLDNSNFLIKKIDECLCYFVPPNSEDGLQDTRLTKLLAALPYPPQQIIYCGSSGVYGDQQGRWIDETQQPNPQFSRQHRRLDAEQQLRNYCEQHSINLTLLRVAGIYGPDRLPHSRLQQPVIDPNEAPLTNHIHIDDLVEVFYQAVLKPEQYAIYNVADGNPQAMGSLQCELASQLNLPTPTIISLQTAFANASPMLKEFLSSSKKLSIDRITNGLNIKLKYPTLQAGVRASLATESN